MKTPTVNGKEVTVGPPLWLLAEVTYACPLHCVFCYNPVDYTQHGPELTTQEWIKVLRDARAAGSVQCGFSGGEPLVRDDLEELVAEAHNFLSHTKTFALKQKAAQLIQANGWPMVLNCVIHRLNIDYIDKIIELAVDLGAEYLELANSQYYSWAQLNREGLMPSREQLQRAERVTNEYREKLGDKLRIFFVVPDYYETRPKKCMNGWGNIFLTITPDGSALPCHTAKMIKHLEFPNVKDMTVKDIWYESESFNHYRGDAWMKEPCSTCPEKEKDLGGCRCQALMLTGDAANADPVCDKSEHHQVVLDAVAYAQVPDVKRVEVKPLVFRDPINSRKLSSVSE